MNSKNLIGMRVGKPEVVADSGHRKNGYILRRCRCGCLTRENGALLHTHLHQIDNTCIESLIRAQKNFKNNTTGFRGLRRDL